MASNPPSATGPVGGRSDDPPAQTNADGLVARVNLAPELDAEFEAERPLLPPVAGSWGIQAIALGLVLLAISVLALILIFTGIFEVMPG